MQLPKAHEGRHEQTPGRKHICEGSGQAQTGAQEPVAKRETDQAPPREVLTAMAPPSREKAYPVSHEHVGGRAAPAVGPPGAAPAVAYRAKSDALPPAAPRAHCPLLPQPQSMSHTAPAKPG